MNGKALGSIIDQEGLGVQVHNSLNVAAQVISDEKGNGCLPSGAMALRIGMGGRVTIVQITG